MVYDVLDRKGLVNANEHLVMFVPATKRAFIFRVIARNNPGSEVLNYGALPISSGESMSSYDGGAVAVPADGVMPARGYTSTGSSLAFDAPSDVTGTYDSTDMWYLPEDYRERLFHVNTHITPSWLRVGVQIPKGTSQMRFQRDRTIVGVDKSYGFGRGAFETVHIPELRMGYLFGNDTNVRLYTAVKFVYGEYEIGIPTDPNAVYSILSKDVPAHWVTLPVTSYDASIRMAFMKDYGFEGYPLYPKSKKQDALTKYNEEGKKVRSEVAL